MIKYLKYWITCYYQHLFIKKTWYEQKPLSRKKLDESVNDLGKCMGSFGSTAEEACSAMKALGRYKTGPNFNESAGHHKTSKEIIVTKYK